MATGFHAGHEVVGDLLWFEPASQDALFELDYGMVEFSNDYLLPDTHCAPGVVGVSNAETGLKYTSPDGEETLAEIFHPANGDMLDGEYEIYPHDGKNRPFTVDGRGRVSLDEMALLGMVWYVSKKSMVGEV